MLCHSIWADALVFHTNFRLICQATAFIKRFNGVTSPFTYTSTVCQQAMSAQQYAAEPISPAL